MAPFSSFRSTLFFSASLLLLSGCGGSSAPKTSAPLPPVHNESSAPAASQPVQLNASDTLTPVLPIAMSVEERIARLEESVGSLRTDYDRIMPAFASLNTTNERIQALLDGMEAEGHVVPANISARPQAAPANAVAVPVPAPVAAPAAIATPAKAEPVVTTPAPQAASPAPADGQVTALRFGEHAGKTRLVFDLKTKTKPAFTYDIDNGEKLLLVDLPGIGWGAASASGKPNSPLVAGWNTQGSPSGGTSVAVQLKKEARILSTEFLPASGNDPARLVVDIASGG